MGALDARRGLPKQIGNLGREPSGGSTRQYWSGRECGSERQSHRSGEEHPPVMDQLLARTAPFVPLDHAFPFLCGHGRFATIGCS